MTKFMDLQEFADKGYLQEANRMFFHPLGIALAISRDTDTGKVISLYGIQDYRDEPGGMVFDEFDQEKVEFIKSEIKRREQERIGKLGSFIQISGLNGE